MIKEQKQHYSNVDPVTLEDKSFDVVLDNKTKLMNGGIERPWELEKYMSSFSAIDDLSYEPKVVTGITKDTNLINFGKYDIDVHSVNGTCIVKFDKKGNPVVDHNSEDAVKVKKELFISESLNTATDFIIKKNLYHYETNNFIGYMVSPKSNPDVMLNVSLTNLMSVDEKRKNIRLFVKPDTNNNNGFKLVEQHLDYNVINDLIAKLNKMSYCPVFDGKVIFSSAYGVSIDVSHIRVYLSTSNMNYSTLKRFVAGELTPGAVVNNIYIDSYSDPSDIIGFQVASADKFLSFEDSVNKGKKERDVYCYAETSSGYKVYDIQAQVTYYLPKATGYRTATGKIISVVVNSVNTMNNSCVFEPLASGKNDK